MALVITTSLPKSLLGALLPDFETGTSNEAWVKANVKRLVEHAASTGTHPVDLALKEQTSIKVNFSVGGVTETIIRNLSKDFGGSPGKTCRALLMGLTQADQAPMTAQKDESLLGVVITNLAKIGIDVTPRPEQTTHFLQLETSLSNRAIGLCEASTGVGKTLAMLVAAIGKSSSTGCRALICTPTLMLMAQFAQTYRQIERAMDVPPLRVILGRAEFVSPLEVQRVLDSKALDFDTAPIKAWLDAGGPSVVPTAETPVFLQNWLSASLILLCPEFPIDDARLPDVVAATDPGFLSYRAQFDESREELPELMLATHAMCAIDIRRRLRIAQQADGRSFEEYSNKMYAQKGELKEKEGREARKRALRETERLFAQHVVDLSEESGLLPPYTVALIDEAHQLESNFSNALSDYCSLRGLVGLLHEYKRLGGKISQKCIDTADQCLKNISLAGSLLDNELLALTSERGQKIVPLLASLLSAVGKLVPLPEKSETNLIVLHRRIEKVLSILRTVSSERARSAGYIKFSPVRAWPQLYIGRQSVANYLRLLWDTLQSGACVSATLYLQRESDASAKFQQMLLAIPDDRAREFQPVVPMWLTRPVVAVYTPAFERTAAGTWLRPPTRSDKLSGSAHDAAEQRWLTEVAQTIAWIWRTAKGGVLVPMTSYDSVTTLAGLLPDDVREVLVQASRDLSLSRQTKRFVEISRSAARPLWLAVGGAWTGLDVSGKHEGFGQDIPAEQDNVITDLVVPRLPFGSNRSITHQYRLSQNSSIPWELLDTAFRTKQVLGRPVRRENLPKNRRFFVLDGRLSDPAFAGYTQLIKRLLETYKNTTLHQADIQIT